VKYDLTTSTGVDDKETIHCEFDVTDTDIEWLSGQIDLYAFVLIYFASYLGFFASVFWPGYNIGIQRMA